MRIKANGLARNMGDNNLGVIELSEITIGRDGGDLVIDWDQRLSLNGNYRLSLGLSKSDIAALFMAAFGRRLSPEILEDLGFSLKTKNFIREKIQEMPFGELLSIARDYRKPETSIDATDFPQKMIEHLEQKGIVSHEDIEKCTAEDMLKALGGRIMGHGFFAIMKKYMEEYDLSFRVAKATPTD